MTKTEFDPSEDLEIHWCPGCGNFSAIEIMKEALSELEIKPRERYSALYMLLNIISKNTSNC